MYTTEASLLNNIFKPDIIKWLDKLIYFIWYKLWFRSIDLGLSRFFLTTYEKSLFRKFRLFSIESLLLVLLFSVSLVVSPLGLVLFLVWTCLFRKLFRPKPFQLSFLPTAAATTHSKPSENESSRSFEILSINVCIFPEFLSRFNNLNNTKERLLTIGNLLNRARPNEYCLLQDQDGLFIDSMQNYRQNQKESNVNFLPVDSSILKDNNNNNTNSANVNIMSDFIGQSRVDFICLQEVWMLEDAQSLTKMLHNKYPFIAYDIGVTSYESNRIVGLTSGLMFASKYPIVNADFNVYKNKISQCKFSAKGLFIAKVSLGKDSHQKNLIGFISNTHMQVYQKTTSIHSKQLKEIHEWQSTFKAKHTDPNLDDVLFDSICGDFNMDNMSPVDTIASNHYIFKEYVDPLSVKPGVDHPLAIGTEMRQFSLYDSAISTPEKFKEVLQNDRLRRWYVFDSTIKYASLDMLKEVPVLDKRDGLPVDIPKLGGKRRVDRILFSKDHELEIMEYNFITSFTRLTDHIPISVKFKCNLNTSER